MKALVIFFIVAISLTSCQQQNDSSKSNEDLLFVIKNRDLSKDIDSITGDTIPFITTFYFDCNIILIDTFPHTFYHKKRFYCLTGNSLNNTLPFFRNLKPEYFKKSDNGKEIIKSIIEDSISIDRVYLISNKDSITDKRYFTLKEKLIENGIGVSTRLITEEEKYVLLSILRNENYDYLDKEWNCTLAVPSDIDFNDEIEVEIEE